MQIKIENARKMHLLSLFFSSQTHPSLLKLTPSSQTHPSPPPPHYSPLIRSFITYIIVVGD